MNVRDFIEQLEELAKIYGDETLVKDEQDSDLTDPEFVDGVIVICAIAN